MIQSIPSSELVLKADGSIYHLNLTPDELADTIILVGDPARVQRISQHFDRIDVQKQHREFYTHTGWIGSKRLSVISTGIGTSNIDIVLNELDALANIDFTTRCIKPVSQSLTLCRIGTCGSLSPTMTCGDFISSSMAVSVCSLMSFYQQVLTADEASLVSLVSEQLNVLPENLMVGSATMDWTLPDKFHHGYTFTASGFYGPQGRQLRLPIQHADFLDHLQSIHYRGKHFLNLEMETAAIFALSHLLGHRAASLSVVLADRVNQVFVDDVASVVDQLIELTLDQLTA